MNVASPALSMSTFVRQLVAENLCEEYHQSDPAAGGQDDKREDELIQLESFQRLLQLKLLVIIFQVNQTSLRWKGERSQNGKKPG